MLKKWIAVLLTLGAVCFSVPVSAGAANADETPRFTVTDPEYGAVDGEECTASFQKALDAAAEVARDDRPAEVYVPAGTYYMRKTLLIDSNITLRCDPNAVIKKLDVSYSYMLRSAENGLGGYENIRNVTVEGGVWDAMYYRYLVNTGGSHMYFVHGENITFRNVTFLHNYGAHMIEVGGVRDLLVEGCTFDGFEMYSTDDEEGGPEKEAVQLDVAHSTKMLPDAEPYDDTPCVDVVVRNNKFLNCSRGFGTHSAVRGVYIENVLVEHNTFENLTDQAVYTYRFLNLTVRNNTIRNAAAGVVFKTRHSTGTSGWYEPLEGVKTRAVTDYKVVIENNQITTTNQSVLTRMQQYGIWVYGIEDDKMSGCVIRNNAVRSASCGIYANFADHVTITENTVARINATVSNSFSADGIKAKSSNAVRIEKNTLLANAGNRFADGIALRTESTGGVISGNTLNSGTVAGHGVFVSTACSAAITGNTVSGCGENGVYVNACRLAGNSVTQNKLTAVGKHGILINYASADKVAQNTLSDCKSNGVYLNDAEVKAVQGNRVAGSAGSGVLVNNATANAIENNTVQNGKSYGVKLDNATVKTIAGNKILKNKKDGVFFNNFSGLSNLYNNTISENGESGIDFENWSSAASVYANKILKNKKDGVSLHSGAKITTLRDNQIKSSGRHGVSAYTVASVTYLKNNTISKSKTNGVTLDNATVKTLSGNKISSAKNDGIYTTEHAKVTTISSNRLSGNKNGVWAQQSSKIQTIKKNTVSSTKTYGVFVGTGSAVTKVQSNKVKTTGGYGVLVSDGTVKTLSSNTVQKSKKYGVYISRSSVRSILKNTLTDNAGALYFSAGKVKSISKNTLTNNGNKVVACYETSKCVRPVTLTLKKVKRGAAKIRGSSAPKSKVTVKIKGKTYTAKTDKTGAFEVKVKACKKKATVQVRVTVGGNSVRRTTKVA